MKSERKKPGVAFWATVGLSVVLPLLYVAAYAFMVDTGTLTVICGIGPSEIYPIYRSNDRKLDQGFWAKVFGPPHWLDKRVRRDKWIFD